LIILKKGLTIRDLEDLLADISVYSNLEKGTNADYWRDISIVTEDELRKLQLLDRNSREHAGDRHEGINQSVLQDVTGLFKGKTYDQLIQLEESIRSKIQNDSGIDINYWESLLSQLKAHMARARLKDRHTKILYEKLQTLKKQQGIDSTKRNNNESHSSKSSQLQTFKSNEKESSSKSKKYKNENEINIDDSDEGEDDEFDRLEKEEEFEEANEIDEATECMKEYSIGNYSPILFNIDDLEIDVFILTQEEDEKRLEIKRNQVLGTGSLKPSAEDEFEAKARDTMGGIIPAAVGSNQDEDRDNGQKSNTQEVSIDHHYLWSDKYRPRKPRYYNRVHTGYDWNQYNKKHYDVDNPPPKTVQGYKFNVFFCLLEKYFFKSLNFINFSNLRSSIPI
jgi:hypothetical protein